MNIRFLQAEDAVAWQQLWSAYLDFYQASVPDAVSRHTWQRLLDTDSPIHGFGAFADNGRLLGFAHCVMHPNTWNSSDCCYLEDLFTDASARRQGVARALVQAVYAEARRRQCNRVYWCTQAGNTGAQALYRQLAQQTDMIQFRHNLPEY